MKAFVLIFFSLLLTEGKAQDTTGIKKDTTVVVPAQFKGGKSKWNRFLEQNLKAEVPVLNGAPEGHYTVIARLLIDTSGNISNIIIEKNPGYGMAEEVIRIFKRSPKWQPATKNGVPVTHAQSEKIYFHVTKQ